MIDWCNDNSGFLTLILFIATIFLGWVSGIFKSLRKKPKFKFSLLPGPTFSCTFDTGRKHNDHPTHRTVIVLYINLKNIGTAPSTISKVKVGYHNNVLKYRFLWFWLNTVPSLTDIGHTVGENLRVFPFLLQQSFLMSYKPNKLLLEGQEVNGVVYFEQEESWGAFMPQIHKNGLIKIKVKIWDVYGRTYSRKFYIKQVDLEFARKFSPEFGNYLENLRNKEVEDWSIFK